MAEGAEASVSAVWKGEGMNTRAKTICAIVALSLAGCNQKAEPEFDYAPFEAVARQNGIECMKKSGDARACTRMCDEVYNGWQPETAFPVEDACRAGVRGDPPSNSKGDGTP